MPRYLCIRHGGVTRPIEAAPINKHQVSQQLCSLRVLPLHAMFPPSIYSKYIPNTIETRMEPRIYERITLDDIYQQQIRHGAG
jgi:hypothetical protein